MKMDRRSFLSFIIGGAAGTTLSPLPWKMMDDSAIWSQNWPWTPVPEDGEVTYTPSTCTLCPGGCGVTIRKINNRAVKIEGTKDHPVNAGGICILGLSGLQLLYGPTRVKTPLKRTGKRGEGKWQKISWEAAISELADQLVDLRSSGKPNALGCVSGSDYGTVPKLFDRLLTVFGSPNFVSTPSMLDSHEMAMYLMQGVRAPVGFDVKNADFVVSFGSGIIEGWGSPVRMFQANSAWKDGNGQLFQIEPRLSNTAAKSNKWIPIKPGTEAALALGLARVIVDEAIYDRGFVSQHTSGFDAWKESVLKDFTPENVANLTGIDRSTIIALARSFARAKHPLALCGKGRGSVPGSAAEFMAVHALNALVGSVNKPGGVWAVPLPDYIKWPELEMDQFAADGLQKARIDEAGSEKYPHTRHLLSRFFNKIAAAGDPPIKILLVTGANPLYTHSGTALVKKAFDKIPIVVSFSSYMDETARQADLILPNHVYLERHEDVPKASGFSKPFIGLTNPAVDPQFDTMHSGDVIIELAKQMGDMFESAFPWEDYQTCLEETLEDRWDVLRENGYWVNDEFEPSPWGSAFETESGAFEFQSDSIGTYANFAPISLPGDPSSFPLVLVPYDTPRLASGYIGNPPFVTKTVPETVLKENDIFVEINPETAKSQGLADGKRARLTTPAGEAIVRIHYFDGIMPGVVAMPRGLGHTAYDRFLGGKGINFNGLVEPMGDPAAGLNVVWGTRASISRA